MHLSISNDIVSTKIYDKRDDFDFEILMLMFLDLHPMEYTSLNSFVLLEHLAMLLISILAINWLLRNFLNKAIGIINFAKHFQNFIDDTMIEFLNFKFDLNLSRAKDFQNLISMVTHFPIGILGEVWYLIVSIHDLCTLTYFGKQIE